MDKCPKHRVEFIEAGGYPAKALESAEQALDFIAATIHNTIIFPRRDPIRLGRNDREITRIKRQLPGFIPFIGTIRQEMDRTGYCSDLAEQLAAFRRVVGMTK